MYREEEVRQAIEELTGKSLEQFMDEARDWAQKAVEIRPGVWGLPNTADPVYVRSQRQMWEN